MTIPASTTTGRHARFWWAFGTVAVLAMTALAVWFGIAGSVGKVHWTNTGFELHGDTSVDVRFDVTRDPGRTVVCELQALDESHARVGTTEVTVGPSESSPSRHIESVRTTSAATTGYVDSCWYLEP